MRIAINEQLKSALLLVCYKAGQHHPPHISGHPVTSVLVCHCHGALCNNCMVLLGHRLKKQSKACLHASAVFGDTVKITFRKLEYFKIGPFVFCLACVPAGNDAASILGGFRNSVAICLVMFLQWPKH